MLAQNFKTAAELGITEIECDALSKVLGMLERGELSHALNKSSDILCDVVPTSPASFHMAITSECHDCGTVACIGGWAATFIPGMSPQDYVNNKHSPNLRELYWPHYDLFDVITPDVAAIAIRSYLSTGEANWAEALRT